MSIVVPEERRLRTELRHSAEVRTLPVPATQTVEHHPVVQGWLPRCRLVQFRQVIAQVPQWQVPRSAERMLVTQRPEPFLPATAVVAAPGLAAVATVAIEAVAIEAVAIEAVAIEAVAIEADRLPDCH